MGQLNTWADRVKVPEVVFNSIEQAKQLPGQTLTFTHLIYRKQNTKPHLIVSDSEVVETYIY